MIHRLGPLEGQPREVMVVKILADKARAAQHGASL
jgi:hypothetical protein